MPAFGSVLLAAPASDFHAGPDIAAELLSEDVGSSRAGYLHCALAVLRRTSPSKRAAVKSSAGPRLQ
jgi:hypothetical protein